MGLGFKAYGVFTAAMRTSHFFGQFHSGASAQTPGACCSCCRVNHDGLLIPHVGLGFGV